MFVFLFLGDFFVQMEIFVSAEWLVFVLHGNIISIHMTSGGFSTVLLCLETTSCTVEQEKIKTERKRKENNTSFVDLRFGV